MKRRWVRGTAPSKGSSKTNTRNKQNLRRRELRFEPLELRTLMTASLDPASNLLLPQAGEGTVATSPVSPGLSLAQALGSTSSSGLAAGSPLSSLPQLHSNPSATAKLFLDFDGHIESSWGGYTNVSTPAYDQDGDKTSFSSGELASINEIWARVSEDYAPFNVDVTTVDPGTQANRVAAVIAIGGSSSDWYGASAGGVSYIGGFYNSAPNVGYVFPSNLGNGYPKYVAEASSHEAGHLFGLLHQSTWSGNTLTNEYNPGNSGWAPIMGVSYYSTRTTWYNGTTSNGPTSFQDDMATISGSNDGFGYKADDFGDTTATATPLAIGAGGNVNVAGLIGKNGDVDYWSFTTTGGAVNLQLAGATYGTDLDSVLELRDSSGQVIVTAAPSTSLGASISTTLGSGTYYVDAKSNGDYGDVGQYTLTGTIATSAPVPELTVRLNGTSLTDGQSVDFGSTGQGTPVTQTFTVTNDGTSALSLSAINAASLPTGFTLVSNLGATSLSPGQSTTFSFRLDATTAGTFSGPIQFANNDSDENPFDLTLSGTVTTASTPVIINDTDAGFSTVGNWTTYPNQGYQGNIHYAATGTGSSVATWTANVTPGQYQVAVTWNAYSNRATNSPFTVLDGSTSLGTTLVNQQLAPADFTDQGVGWKTLGTFNVTGNSLVVTLNNNANQYVIADAVRIVRTGSLAGAPEVTVRLNGASLTDGQTVDFGSTAQGTPVTQTFTVTNDGTSALSLSAINAASLPAGFTLASNLGATLLNPGQSTTFSIRLDATTAGTFSGPIQFANNDSDENPFDLTLSGTVTTASTPVIINDTDAGFSTVGNWTTYPNQGYQGGIHYAATGTGSSVATWTANVIPGQYQVAVTWNAYSNRATNSPFTVRDGSTSLGTTLVNQQLAPADFTDQGVGWKTLGTFNVAGNSLVVTLNNNANQYVIADAVRIVRTGSLAGAPEVTVLLNGTSLTDGQTVDFGSTPQGTPVTQTFTVTNDGTSALSLSAINAASLPAGFTLVSNLGATSLDPGQSTTFSIRLDATTAGTFSGPIQFANNDSDENPFDLTLSGTVTTASVPVIINDTDAGFSTVGNWTTYPNQGYQGNIHYAATGTGSSVATWTANVTPGQYQVAVTWNEYWNRATNSPFTVLDGSTSLGATLVNQQLAPADFTDQGVGWKTLGTFNVTGNSLLVTLNNNANQYVIADAVRIVRVGNALPIDEHVGSGNPQVSAGNESDGELDGDLPPVVLDPTQHGSASIDVAQWLSVNSAADANDTLHDVALEAYLASKKQGLWWM